MRRGPPSEAVLAVVASLRGRQHVGVRRAGEDQLSDLHGPGDPQSAALARAVKPLHYLDDVLHRCFIPQVPSKNGIIPPRV